MPAHRLPPRRRAWHVAGVSLPIPTPREGILGVMVLSVVLLLGNLMVMRIRAVKWPDAATTLWTLADRRATEPRGIIVPIYDRSALLGMSLIMELRGMDIDLPIEVPHCGDLSDDLREQLEQNADWNVYVYDVCIEAKSVVERTSWGRKRAVFCEAMGQCQKRFGTWDIKVIAVIFSRFQEIMMVDPDVVFFQDPSSLWELERYRTTGTLFFHDLIDAPEKYLGKRVTNEPVEDTDHTHLHEFILRFNRFRFDSLPNERIPTSADAGAQHQTPSLKRAMGELEQDTDALIGPSEYLKNTHAWNLRSGHQTDSSVFLWNKQQKPRATAILASFVSLRYSYRPPSHRDKELYFLACEVAEAEYAFSDFAVGAIGSETKPEARALCGDPLQFYPVRQSNARSDDDVAALYVNSHHLADWDLEEKPLLRTTARVAEHYPGSFKQHRVPSNCPFDLDPVALTEREQRIWRRRQENYRTLQRWHDGLKNSDDTGAQGNNGEDAPETGGEGQEGGEGNGNGEANGEGDGGDGKGEGEGNGNGNGEGVGNVEGEGGEAKGDSKVKRFGEGEDERDDEAEQEGAAVEEEEDFGEEEGEGANTGDGDDLEDEDLENVL